MMLKIRAFLRNAILSKLPLKFRMYLSVLKNRIVGNALKFRKINVGANCYIDPSVQIIGYANVALGNNTTLSEDVWLNVNHRDKAEMKIIIGNNCHIGRRNFFSSGPLIHIKDYCFTGIDCRFLGCGHIMDSPFIPYIASGLTPGDNIELGINCWLTTAVTVMQGVKIGYGSIIGAGSVVLKDVPPFSVAAGNPCRVLKRFDFKNNQWVNICDWSEESATFFPLEDEYLSLLKEKYLTIPSALIASSSRFGWL